MAPRMARNSKGQTSERSSGRVAARGLTDATIRALRDGESRVDGALPVGAGPPHCRVPKNSRQLATELDLPLPHGVYNGRVQLGDYPAIALEEARTRARAHIENVKQGVDPKIAAFEQKQAIVKAEREKASLGSFRSLIDSYVAHLKSKGKPSARDVEKTFDRYVLKPWPDLAPLPARAISSEIIRDILARMITLGIGRQTNIVRATPFTPHLFMALTQIWIRGVQRHWGRRSD